jgi:cytochrome b
MRHKLELQKGQQPRTLTASEIRTRVEDIAEDLALKMRPGTDGNSPARTEAFPLDTNKFIRHMSEFIRMN